MKLKEKLLKVFGLSAGVSAEVEKLPVYPAEHRVVGRAVDFPPPGGEPRMVVRVRCDRTGSYTWVSSKRGKKACSVCGALFELKAGV